MKKALKRSLSLVLAITIIFSSAYVGLSEVDFGGLFAVEAKAASEDDLTFTLNGDGESYSVTDCVTSASGELIIPSIYEGLPVTRIGIYAFEDCTSLTSITIPEGVTKIDICAFYNCTSLTSITMPDSITSIGGSAFDYCKNLTSVTIPENVTEIGCAFSYCVKLEKIYWNAKEVGDFTSSSRVIHNAGTSGSGIEIVFGDTVKKIPAYLCYSNSLITSVIIGENVTSIGASAFYDCKSLTSVIIGDSVTSIGSCAFENCINLDSVTIPENVTTIGASAFYGCKNLISITIPDNVRSIGRSAFGGLSSLNDVYITDLVKWCSIAFNDSSSNPLVYCDNLYLNGEIITDVVIPEGVTNIRDYAFYGFASLTSVKIPKSVTSIGGSVFSYCKNLTSVTIPNSVTSIGESAFIACASLKSIIIPDSVESIGSETFNSCTSLTSVNIGNGVTSIGNSAFSSCTSLTSITIPDRVTSIGEKAFYKTGCYNDSSNWENDVLYIDNHLIEAKDSITGDYEIKKGTKTIANRAFDGCINLTSITISDSVTNISDYTFYNCTSLTSITIPDSVISIDERSFEGCTNLNLITIPNSVTSIGDYAFYGCTNLDLITIPDNVTSIGNKAFYNTGCYNDFSNWENDVLYIDNHLIEAKESITGDYVIKECTKTIADFAFEYCPNLTAVIIPAGIRHIGSAAFKYSQSLKSVNIPNTVKSIGSSAFLGCQSLKSIIIPDGVKSIEDYTFWECGGLTSITIPDSVTSIGNYAFADCYYLTPRIPDRVTSIGDYAFRGCRFESVTIPNDVTYIGNYTFSRCTNLKTISIPDSVTKIGYCAFEECTSLTSITIPDGVTDIGSSAFKDCTNLTSVNIPVSVKHVLFNTFYNCTALTSVTIPASVVSIGEYAFYNCQKLENINYRGLLSDWENVIICVGNDCLLKANCTHLCTYRDINIASTCTEAGSKYRYCIICDVKVDVTEIPPLGHDFKVVSTKEEHPHTISYKCSRCPETNDEEIYSQKCGACTFSYINTDDKTCKITGYIGNDKTSFIIPGTILGRTVATTTNAAFNGITTLTSVEIKDGVQGLGMGAFMNCTSLSKIIIPESVKSIGKRAFYNCADDFTIYCYRDSTAMEYAIANKHKYVLMNIGETENSTIDYENKMIYTTASGSTNLDDIIYTPSTSAVSVQASLISGGKEYLGTGSIITVVDNNGTTTDYVLVVEGDTNGDSVCDALDAWQVSLASNGHGTLEGAYSLAGDGNSDDVIDVIDYQAIVNKAVS